MSPTKQSRRPRAKTRVQVTLDDDQIAQLDAYRRKQHNPPDRAEAFRQLLAKAKNAA